MTKTHTTSHVRSTNTAEDSARRVSADPLTPPPSHRLTVSLLFLLLLPAAGCLERRIHITTEPSGAVVTLNDVEIGRTPCSTGFTYYGVYDVRIRKEGYDPITTGKDAAAPWYEYPGIDLVSTALPRNIKTDLYWHWDLKPLTPGPDPELPERARELRAQLGPAPAAEEPEAPAPAPEDPSPRAPEPARP